MNQVLWEKVKNVYGEAVERPAEQRVECVLSMTEDDPEVRSEVLRLLEEERQMGDFMIPLTLTGAVAVLQPADREAVFAAGHIIADRYRIEGLVNAGGMGEVYDAYDLKLEQRVALKTILPEIAGDRGAMDRFRREVALSRNVTHPNVCRVFDFGEHREDWNSDPIAFLSMEYLDGETLRERLRRSGPIAPERALSYVRQILQALEAAHQAGVVHRDLKPGNVILVPAADGGERVVVTDFGLARSMRECNPPGERTRTGDVLGTPAYMAPEQWAGGTIGPSTDFYALGILMHEMLSGEKPGSARSSSPIKNSRWARAMSACLQSDPAARPQTAREVLTLLTGPASSFTAAVRGAAWRWVLSSLVLLALLFAIFRLYNRQAAGPANAAVKHVVVLPLRVAEEELRLFADGFVEGITQRLSQYEGVNHTLTVSPAREISPGLTTAREAKRQLGADLAIEGSLHSQQNRLRLVLAVIDTSDMRQIEAGIVDGTRDKAFALQDEAVAKLAGMLDLRVLPRHAGELNRVNPVDPGAYDFYLQAKGYLQRNDRVGDVESAVSLLKRSLDQNPRDAAAHAALGEAYWFLYERTSDRAWVAKALDQCRKALQYDPRLAESHATMGRVLVGTGRPAEAVEAFRTALTIDPRLPEAYHGLGRAYTELKDYDKAEATYRKAIELRSRDWRGYRELGLFYWRRSDYRKAIEQFNKVVMLSPDNAGAYNNLGGFYGLLGEKDKAREMLQKAVEIDPDRISTLTNLTKMLSDDGRNDEAVKLSEKAVERRPSSYRLWGSLAAVYLRAGRQADARRSFVEAARLTSEAIAVNPKSAELYSHRAHFLASLGRVREVPSDLEKTGSLSGSDVEMLIRDAVTSVLIGRQDKAAEYLRIAVKHGYSPKDASRNEYLREALARVMKEQRGASPQAPRN